MRQEYSSSKYTKSLFRRFSEWPDGWSRRFVVHSFRRHTNLDDSPFKMGHKRNQ